MPIGSLHEKGCRGHEMFTEISGVQSSDELGVTGARSAARGRTAPTSPQAGLDPRGRAAYPVPETRVPGACLRRLSSAPEGGGWFGLIPVAAIFIALTIRDIARDGLRSRRPR